MSLLQLYANEYCKDSESPKQYHQWCIISAVAALLGRNFYLPFGHSNVYPNIYAMLIGSPGARKSTAIKAATALAKAAGYDNIAANKTTKEKFLLDLHGHKDDSGSLHVAMPGIQSRSFTNLFGDDASIDDARSAEILIAADEFTNFVGSGNYEFISLLGELWDCPDSYTNRVKNSKSFVIKEPCVNILSGNTAVGLAAAFPPDVIGQGFVSRLILIYGERTEVRNTIPRAPSETVKTALVETLAAIRTEIRGPASLSEEAFAALDWLYKNWEDLEDIRFQNYSSRRLTHLLKLCMVNAAMNLRTEILLEDVVFANTLLTVTEEDMPMALGEIGKGRYSDAIAKIIEILHKNLEPMSMNELYAFVQPDLESFKQMQDIMVSLVQAKRIQNTKHGFLPIKKPKKEAGKYFDKSLIQ